VESHQQKEVLQKDFLYQLKTLIQTLIERINCQAMIMKVKELLIKNFVFKLIC